MARTDRAFAQPRALATDVGPCRPQRPRWPLSVSCTVGGKQRPNVAINRFGECLRDDLLIELARRGSSDVKRIRAVRGLERGDLQRRLGEIALCIQRGIDVPETECPPRIPRDQMPQLSVLGQFLFAALGSIRPTGPFVPNLVATPNDIRELIVYRSVPASWPLRHWPVVGGRKLWGACSTTCWRASSRSASPIQNPIIP